MPQLAAALNPPPLARRVGSQGGEGQGGLRQLPLALLQLLHLPLAPLQLPAAQAGGHETRRQ